MLRLLADADFNGRILDGLTQRLPQIDVLRAQDILPPRAPDTAVLEFAAETGRVVMTHDVNTMVGFGYARVEAGRPMPGLIAVPQSLPIGHSVEDLLVLVSCSREHEWDEQVLFLPL